MKSTLWGMASLKPELGFLRRRRYEVGNWGCVSSSSGVLGKAPAAKGFGAFWILRFQHCGGKHSHYPRYWEAFDSIRVATPKKIINSKDILWNVMCAHIHFQLLIYSGVRYLLKYVKL